MFEKNAMLSFETLDEFTKFYDDLDIYENWKITDEPINVRGEKVRNSPYINLFRTLFNSKNLFRRSVSVAELVSFIDNFYLMNKLIEKLRVQLSDDEYRKIAIFSEYKIMLSKNRRIDFIITYGDKKLLLEFRISNTFPNLSNIWQKKEGELIIYKELLKNYLPLNNSIYIYAFIGMPEYCNNSPISKQIKYNENNLDHLSKYIHMFLIKDRDEINDYSIQ